MPGTGQTTKGTKLKAFLLAAGLGTRLRPLTEHTPKCLVPINGKPLMEYWFELFRKYGVDEVLVNTHYLRDQVGAYIKKHNASGELPKVKAVYEAELLGSGGTVKMNEDFVDGEEDFLICYADNLTSANLEKLCKLHKEKQCILTMGLFRASNPKECGIAELDENGRIVSFIEKPEVPKSNLSNGGIYVVSREIFSYIPEGFSDFGKDVLPKLVGKMYGSEIEEYLLDIGTPEKYQKAQIDAKNLF